MFCFGFHKYHVVLFDRAEAFPGLSYTIKRVRSSIGEWSTYITEIKQHECEHIAHVTYSICERCGREHVRVSDGTVVKYTIDREHVLLILHRHFGYYTLEELLTHNDSNLRRAGFKLKSFPQSSLPPWLRQTI